MYPSTPLYNNLYNNNYNNPYNNVMNMNNDYINNDIQQIIIRRSPKKNINMEDTLDRTFMDALKEIELNYISLSKPLRLRIEKWIEKLCTVSGVNTWRKERNIYARLLLNMILRRQLTEPFHQYPPDGSLPNLANHLKRNPDDLGSHESQFWRSLYKRVGVSPNKNNNNNSNNKSYSIIDIEENNTNINNNHNINEIKNLNNLVREQAIRIKLLEQQLHDERIQTELQIQRLQHLHRVELNNFQQQATNMYSSSSGGSSSSSSSNHINSNIVDNHHNFVHNIIKKTEIQSNSPFVDNFLHNMESEINNATTTPLKYENISSASIANNNNNNNNNNKNNMSQKPTDPEAFLAYLDKFQNEIKKL